MKAIIVDQYGTEEVLKLKEIEKPNVGKEQVLVELKAIGVNPVDIYLRSGEARFISPPFTPGFDGVGVVAEVGEGVSKFKAGDRVFTLLSHTGTYAEYVLCRESQLFSLPQSLCFEEGAGLYIPYGTAYQALVNACRITGDETVLVHGASGAVGLAAVQTAVEKGCRVIGTAGSEKGRQLVLDNGAEYALDHRSAAHYRKIKEITKSRGVDIILEMASVNIPDDVNVLAQFGRIIIIGGKNKEEMINPLSFTDHGYFIMGINIGHLQGEALQEFNSYVRRGARSGFLKPVINKAFPLKDAAKAHRFLMQEDSYGKIILIP